MSQRAGERWTYPARAMVGTVPLEDVPVITADGKHIYDMARRPVPGQTAARRTSGLPTGSVTGGATLVRSIPRSTPCRTTGSSLWERWRGLFQFGWKGSAGLFVSRLTGGRYAEPVALDAPVRASGSEAMPFVARTAGISCFSANYDIHVSFRATDGTWLPPVSLPPPVNTPTWKCVRWSRRTAVTCSSSGPATSTGLMPKCSKISGLARSDEPGGHTCEDGHEDHREADVCGTNLTGSSADGLAQLPNTVTPDLGASDRWQERADLQPRADGGH